ncbi:DNA repair protein RadC [Paraferrimonas sp. SM1919]|uniref:RadC family protein n=1 Tax=Paraferrimonas sp. SM1919 TaxID=2662263 RepID=UPI0013D3240F|nr:DNA repair protein RadC [Paraferrimonas sp. SM1919]
MSIKDWPNGEGPREKCLKTGAHVLSDAELLAIILRQGNSKLSAVDLGRALLDYFGSLSAVFNASKKQLARFDGIGPVKIAELYSVLQLSVRLSAEKVIDKHPLNNPEQTRDYLKKLLGGKQRETFGLLLLDSQHQVIEFCELFHGTINSAAVYPREVVKIVLEKGAAAVILVHNHPSGVAEPSQADRNITEKLVQALNFIDVSVLDHMIVGQNLVTSFAQRGWL